MRKRLLGTMLVIGLIALTSNVLAATSKPVIENAGFERGDVAWRYWGEVKLEWRVKKGDADEEVGDASSIKFDLDGRQDKKLSTDEWQKLELSKVTAPARATHARVLMTIWCSDEDGNQRSAMKLEHEDGAIVDAMFDVNDWCAENPGLGGVHGVVTDYRHTLGGPQTCKTSLWMAPIRLRSASPLKSITLPKNPNIFVAATTLGPAGEERRVQTYIKDAFVPSQEAGIEHRTSNGERRIMAPTIMTQATEGIFKEAENKGIEDRRYVRAV